MSEKRYDYLQQQWNSFYTDVDTELKGSIDTCFSVFKERIQSNNGLTLEHYAMQLYENCSYLCNFIERTSSKIYGSARPGNMYNYGISLIGEKKEEEKFFINDSLLPENAKGEQYKSGRYQPPQGGDRIAAPSFQLSG